MEGGLLLDVVVRECPAILKLLASEDQPLLVWGDSFLVLDFGLHIFDGVRRLHFKGDGLPGQSLDENLHTSSQPEDKMEGGLLLDVVVRECPSILKLLASKDQPLLIWGDSFLILDLGLNILNGVRRLNLKGDGLSSQGLDKDLHTSPQPEDKMESGLLLDVVVREGPAILKLLASKDQSLLIWGDSFLVLNLGLYILYGVRRLNFKGDCLSCQCLDPMEGGLLLDVVIRESPTIFQLLSSKNQPLLVWWNSLLVLDLGLHILNCPM